MTTALDQIISIVEKKRENKRNEFGNHQCSHRKMYGLPKEHSNKEAL